MSQAISLKRTFEGTSTVDPDVKLYFEFIEPEDQEVHGSDNNVNITLRALRQSLVHWEGFFLPDGVTPLPSHITQGDKEILIEDNQKAVFRWFNNSDPVLMASVLEAYTGITRKKSIGGSTPPFSGSGPQTIATDANSQEEVAESADATAPITNPS